MHAELLSNSFDFFKHWRADFQILFRDGVYF